MGAAKNKKTREAVLNRSVWILMSLLGIVIGHIDKMLYSLKDEISNDTQNDMRVIKNCLERIDKRIYADKTKIPIPVLENYDVFYKAIDVKIEELMDMD